VTSYTVSWDQGTGSWVVRQTGVSTLSYQTTSVTVGTTYTWRVQAVNSHGTSLASSELSVLAADKPATMSAPVTSISGTNVVITWTSSYYNGAAITAYTVKIRQVDGVTYSQELTYCSGLTVTTGGASISTLSTSGGSTLTCTIPQATLKASPFSLTSGSQVLTQVQATNSVGTSAASSNSNGVTLP
jgi:hypothetical protein